MVVVVVVLFVLVCREVFGLLVVEVDVLWFGDEFCVSEGWVVCDGCE